MNWKSFKDEKPLDGQRVLIYVTANQYFEVLLFDKSLQEFFKNEIGLAENAFWCPIPALPNKDHILLEMR